MCRILEGKLLLPPVEIGKIAELFGKTKKELLSYEADKFVPELQYMKEFSNTDNLDKILDLLDDYVELKELMEVEGCTKTYSLFRGALWNEKWL